MVNSTTHRPYEFVGNHIALDLVNTVNARPTFTRDDLRSTDHLLEWATLAGVPDGAELRADAEQLDWFLRLRESVYAVFGPIAAGGPPDGEALAHIVATSAGAARAAEWV